MGGWFMGTCQFRWTWSQSVYHYLTSKRRQQQRVVVFGNNAIFILCGIDFGLSERLGAGLKISPGLTPRKPDAENADASEKNWCWGVCVVWNTELTQNVGSTAVASLFQLDQVRFLCVKLNRRNTIILDTMGRSCSLSSPWQSRFSFSFNLLILCCFSFLSKAGLSSALLKGMSTGSSDMAGITLQQGDKGLPLYS